MNIKSITPIFGSYIETTSFQEMMLFSKDFWKDLLYKSNIIIINSVSLSEEQFVQFSHQLGTPWTQAIYRLHGENMEANGIVYWSDKSGLHKKALCWHKDNSWSSKWRHPIRILFSVRIPDKNSGIIHYLDTSYIYNNILSSKEKNRLSEYQVLIQDYKNKQRRFLYPLVQQNPISKKKSLFITAMDFNENFFGLKKDINYIKGNTFLLKVLHPSGKELPLKYLVEYIKSTMKIKGCHFYKKWNKNTLQIISNLDVIHMRTKISNHPSERLIWRKTIAHDFQMNS